jgi:transposase
MILCMQDHTHEQDKAKERLEDIISKQARLLQEKEKLLQDKDIVINNLQADNESLIKDKDIIINNLQADNELLRLRIQQLLDDLYGKKSEKIPSEDLPVADEAIVTPEEEAIIVEAEEAIKVPAYMRIKPKRKPLPEYLPRETLVHDLPLDKQVCSCGHQLHCIGEEISEKLDYVPAKVKVIQNIRKKYGCRNCETGITTAVLPAEFLPKSIAAAGLLANVILAKYADHCPLYRQESIWQRIGVDIARSTLCNWVLMAASKLQILISLMRDDILQTHYARADETPVQVLEDKQLRTSKKAYMWLFASGRTDKAIIVYEFSMSRAGVVAEEFFDSFAGFLQSDGFSGYNKLGNSQNITRVGCMAHARRKFVAIVKTAKQAGAAHYAVAIIAKLYKIEADIKDANLSHENIYQYRQQYAKPIIEEFEKWLMQKKEQSPPKGPLGKAIYYCLEQWQTLTVYLDYGFLDIDNNFAERCIRPFAIGRKNWLFMGNERGGIAAAVFFSLIESAKANGLNTYAYLRFLMSELPLIDSNNKDELIAILPHKIQESRLTKYLT